MFNKTFGLIALWVISRVWVLLSGFQVIDYPQGESLFADVRLYDWWAGNMQDGHFPINDPMWQYPPLAALVFLLGYLIAPQTIGFVFLATAIDALIFYFLLEAGNEKEKKTYLPAFVWVLSAILMGPIMLGRFDVFPTFFAVTALLFAAKPKLFGINLALGAILKVWPALLLLGVSKAKLIKSVTWFSATFISLSILLTLWWPNSFSFITGQRSRGLQIESVPALPYMIWNALVERLPIEFRYGAIEVVAGGIGKVSLVITFIGALLLVQVVIWRVKGRLENVAISDIAIYVVAVSMVTSRVLSPQYSVWLFGLLAVCALNPGPQFKRIFGLIGTSALLGQLIYPAFYQNYMAGEPLALLIQVARIAALLFATYLMWLSIKRQLSPVN